MSGKNKTFDSEDTIFFYRFSGGPPCNRLFECTTCRQEQEALYQRMSQELEEFLNLNSVSEAA